MYFLQKWPELNEIVVIKITKVLPYGAFAELLEYDNIQGFVHISQVASRWVKNIRSYVRPNQIRAAQVIHVDKAKQQIDLSLTKVSESQQKAKIEEWELSKRARKILEIFAKQQKLPFEKAWAEIAEPLIQKHGNLMSVFQDAIFEGESALQDVPKEYVKPLLDLISKSIEIPEKEVSAVIKIKSYEPDAIDSIKKAFEIALKEAQDMKVNATYIGGGKYLLVSKAYDYKTAERALNSVSEKLIKEIEKRKGAATIEKKR